MQIILNRSFWPGQHLPMCCSHVHDLSHFTLYHQTCACSLVRDYACFVYAVHVCISTHTLKMCTHFPPFSPPLSFTHSNRNSSMLHQLVNNAILVNKSRERGLMETYPETENDKNKIKLKKDPEETNLLLLWG